jgi:hypothetical protein
LLTVRIAAAGAVGAAVEVACAVADIRCSSLSLPHLGEGRRGPKAATGWGLLVSG